jgi:hypothetical protein
MKLRLLITAIFVENINDFRLCMANVAMNVLALASHFAMALLK